MTVTVMKIIIVGDDDDDDDNNNNNNNNDDDDNCHDNGGPVFIRGHVLNQYFCVE